MTHFLENFRSNFHEEPESKCLVTSILFPLIKTSYTRAMLICYQVTLCLSQIGDVWYLIDLPRQGNQRTDNLDHGQSGLMTRVVSCYEKYSDITCMCLWSAVYVWIVPQMFKLLPKRHIFFDLVIRFIRNRKYAFFCIF